MNQDPNKIFLPLKKDKKSCFNCFKVFLVNEGFEYCEKPFCSIPCKQELQDKYNVVCEIENCKRPIYKGLSIFENSKYFCSQNCFRKSEEYLKINKSIENINKTQSLAEKNDENDEQSIEIEYDPMEDF